MPEGFYQCGCGYSHRDSHECLAQSTGELDFIPVNRYSEHMKTNEKQTPARAYSAKLLQARALLERLEAELKQHARQSPTWAAVGDLDHVAGNLQDLVDSLAGEGEYAPDGK